MIMLNTACPLLFLTNQQGPKQLIHDKHLVDIMVSQIDNLLRHFLACYKPADQKQSNGSTTCKDTNVITQLLIPTKKQRYLLYCFVECHLFLNALRRKRKHVIFTHLVTNYFYFHKTYLLTCWWDATIPV